MKNILYLGLSTLLSANKSVLSKLIKGEKDSFLQTMKKNLISFSIGFAILLLLGVSQWHHLKNAPFLLSFFYAFFALLAQAAFTLSVSIGPCSISTLFYSCGFVIPTLWGSMYYQEGFSIFACLGLLCILATFALFTQKDASGKLSFSWLITALLGFLGSGFMGVVQKIFIKTNPYLSLSLFLIPAFAFVVALGGLLVAILWFFERKNRKNNTTKNPIKNKEKTKKEKTLSVVFTLGLGITLGFVHTVNTYLADAFPSYITFPVINGGTIVLTGFFSYLYLKEPLTKKKIIGFLTGIIGIILISIG